MDFDVRVTLVILQADVVLGTMPLDEVHLEDERFELPSRPRSTPYPRSRARDGASCVVTGIRVEIGADAVLQADGLADVDDRPLGVL